MSYDVLFIKGGAMFKRNSHLRTSIFLMFAVLLGLGLTVGDTEAKKKKNRGTPNKILMTGVKSFDKVFKQARKANRQLKAAQSELRTSRVALRAALKLGKKTTYSDGLKELQNRAKGKVKLYANQGQLELKAADAVPTDVKNGVGAVNQLTTNLPSALKNLKGVITNSQKMYNKAQKFPENLQAELSNQGVVSGLTMLFKLPQITRKTMDNIKVIGAMPKRATKTTNHLLQISKTIKNLF